MPFLPPWNPLKISHVESQRSGSTELFRQVGWGRPMFITVFFFFFYTKKHQRKLWKRTTPPRKGWAERAVTESIRATWSADSWSLSPLLEHKHWFFPKANSVRKGQKLLWAAFLRKQKGCLSFSSITGSSVGPIFKQAVACTCGLEEAHVLYPSFFRPVSLPHLFHSLASGSHKALSSPLLALGAGEAIYPLVWPFS